MCFKCVVGETWSHFTVCQILEMRDSREFLMENLLYDFSAIANTDAAVIEVLVYGFLCLSGI